MPSLKLAHCTERPKQVSEATIRKLVHDGESPESLGERKS